jgi:hypothetical protein
MRLVRLATLGLAATGLLAALVAVTALGAPVPVASRMLTVYRSCTLTATPAASTVAGDTYVNQASPTTPAGSGTFVDVRSSINANRRTYILYDLNQCSPQIPSSATVTGGILRLYVTAVPTVCRTQEIFRMTSTWSEAGVTWNNQPVGTAPNQPPSNQRTGAITVGAAPCQNTSANTYITGWDVTVDVAAFILGTANHGWMIRDATENATPARNVQYASKEAGVVAQAPQLIVTYRVTA